MSTSTLAPWIERQLLHLLSQKGHAWLLAGPSGLGQYSLGHALAKAWLCEQPNDKGACGECSSCIGFEARTNPDLFVLMPEVMMLEHEWPMDEKVQKELEDKKRKPSQEIKVDAARALVSFGQITRSGRVGKVAWVHPAERLNTISANALLKTLEEPPADFRFVLTSGAVHALLPTIRSRCQTHILTWPTQQESLDWLLVNGIETLEAAQVFLKASGQRVEEALVWAQLFDFKPSRWLQLPKALANGEVNAVSDLNGPQTVQVLQMLCHDLMCLHHGQQGKYFSSESLPKAPKFSALSEWSKLLLQSAQTADHPFNLGLMHEALVAQTRLMLS